MFGWWVLLIVVAVQVVALIIDLRVLYYYMHEDDMRYTQGILAQIVVLLGLQLIWLMFCLLPTDAYNAYFDTGLNMEFFWQLVFLTTVIMLAIPLPFALFYYEADSDPRISKSPPWKVAGCKTLIVAICVIGFCGITFLLFRKVSVPSACVEDPPPEDCVAASGGDKINTTVNFLTYLVALPSFVGWFFFAVLGGMGMALAPMKMIVDFIYRPQPISAEEYQFQKKKIAERAAMLKGFGEALLQKDAIVHAKKGVIEKQRAMYNYRQQLSKYKQAVLMLEEDYNRMELCMHERGENPFYSYLKLSLGIFFAILTLVWLIQIICYDVLPDMINSDPFFPWMNTLFEALRKTKTYILESLFYYVNAFYLLYCAFICGIRIGQRFQKWFPVEQLAKNQTHLNVIAYHVTFSLLQAASVTQFSVLSLSEYAKGTRGLLIFSSQAEYMKLFSSFYKHWIFEWVLLIVFIIALIWNIIYPKPKMAIDFNNPKQMEKWIKLQKQLGIDQNAVGAVKKTDIPTPDPNAPPPPQTIGDKLRGKLDRFDQAADPSKLAGKVAAGAVTGGYF